MKRDIFTRLGVALIAAALLLTGYNIWDDRRAASQSEKAAGELEALIPEEPVVSPKELMLALKRLQGGEVAEIPYTVTAEERSSEITNLGTEAEEKAASDASSHEAAVPPAGSLFVNNEPVAIPGLPYDITMENGMPTRTIKGNNYIGMIYIPKIKRNLPVLSGWSEALLKKAPCRYSGSVYEGSIVIAGHNYLSHLGYLKKVAVGDRVRFTDTLGNVFNYRVCSSETVEPTSIKQMKTGDWDLTLFTCTNGGKARYALRCELVE